MMKNNTLKQIKNKLAEAELILLYPHIVMDGDTLGSSVALCKALRKQGKKAFVLIEDEIPSYLKFLDKDYCISDYEVIKKPDVSIAIDCSDIGRFENRKDKFFDSKCTICIDHHPTNNYYGDFNYIDVHASATAEIIYDLIQIMDVELDKEMAEALYTGIATDSGNFQYTNTTKKTHLVTAELFDLGIDLEKVSAELYQNIRHEKLKIRVEVLSTIEMLCNGKANVAYVTQNMLKNTGALMEETEGIIEDLRNISGVEISAFLKETNANQIKVGFRAKTYGDVASIAQTFGGGGHKKAAGCTFNTTLEEAKRQVMQEIKKQLDKTQSNFAEKENQAQL